MAAMLIRSPNAQPSGDPSLRVCLIGFGSIGKAVRKHIDDGAAPGVEICGALVRDASKHQQSREFPLYTNLSDLLDNSPGVVVEVAGPTALKEYGPSILRSGFDLTITSVGALADQGFFDSMLASAQGANRRFEYVSGAIGALDAIAAAAIGGLDEVTLTTSKPATTLLTDLEREGLTGPREMFAGSAREAAALFPDSLNVGAALSLAGLGFDKTWVKVVADPLLKRNQHAITARGNFGELVLTVSGLPSADNPKTARLVSMSVVSALKNRRDRLG